MAAKANIYVYGSVQPVGYRVYVKNVSAMIGFKGLVRNRGDGTVESLQRLRKMYWKRFIKSCRR